MSLLLAIRAEVPKQSAYAMSRTDLWWTGTVGGLSSGFTDG